MIEYYTVENTGWSGGMSWFGGETRLEKEDAFERARKAKEEYNDQDMHWRVVEVHIHTHIGGRVTVEKYHPI